MSNPQCPCAVCGNPCIDWKLVYPNDRYQDSICKDCDTIVSQRLRLIYSGVDNAYYPSTPQHAVIQEMIGERQGFSSATSKPSARQEKPCKQCTRMNDVGINKCWFCEVIIP